MGEFEKDPGGKPGFDKEQQGDDYSKDKGQQQQDGGKQDGSKPDFEKGGQQ